MNEWLINSVGEIKWNLTHIWKHLLFYTLDQLFPDVLEITDWILDLNEFVN